MNDIVKVTIDGAVARVTLNRPDKANALNLEMFDALGDTAAALADNRALRAVVLHGAGANFCGGIDVDMFRGGETIVDAKSMLPVEPSPANRFQLAAYAWRALPVPVICAINGVAYGGGLQIALGADLRYAAPDARLSIMEIKWGLIPDMGITTTLRDILPVDRVKELAWSGRAVDAEEALRYGLVTALHEDPLQTALQTAEEICGKSPDAIRAMKNLFNAAWQLSEAEALALEAKLQAGVIGQPNQLEAVMANVEKRPPEFKD
jgi:enoyl-CoA hydratase/carnithine racemase